MTVQAEMYAACPRPQRSGSRPGLEPTNCVIASRMPTDNVDDHKIYVRTKMVNVTNKPVLVANGKIVDVVQFAATGSKIQGTNQKLYK